MMLSIGIAGGAEAMALVAVLRHGPTEWTSARRLQGRADVELSPLGRAVVGSWRLPARIVARSWLTSPLRRCVETASILRLAHPGAPTARVESRLIEMSYGDWEGHTLAALRAADGAAVAARESLGLDFQAPGGESPRAVQDRLRRLLGELADGPGDILAIAHKGVIRALYALATGWDMRNKPRHRLVDEAIHEFRIDSTGLQIVALNIGLGSPAEIADRCR
jgi:probable phosphoglycerate mutase